MIAIINLSQMVFKIIMISYYKSSQLGILVEIEFGAVIFQISTFENKRKFWIQMIVTSVLYLDITRNNHLNL